MKLILKHLALAAMIGLALIPLGGSKDSQAASQPYVRSTTPTLFFHGWGSSARAEEQMTNYARRHGVTKTIVQADVSAAGKVTWHGTIKAGAINPIIEVNLQNNKSVTGREADLAGAYAKSSNYVKAVVTAMQKRYGFTTMNLVGHSMGNLQIAYYLATNANDPHLPRLVHQVSIAGHYNGLVGEADTEQINLLGPHHRPQHFLPEYQGLLGLRHRFPTSAQVLNIYGDLNNGTRSDGDVPVNSARSYQYLVSGRAQSYHELKITGRQAQHSRLHENHQVDQVLVNFLWR